jgi:hypothetical protein
MQEQPHDGLTVPIYCIVQECSVLNIARRNVATFIKQVFHNIRGLYLHSDRQWRPPFAVHGAHCGWAPFDEYSYYFFLSTVHCKVQHRLARRIPRAPGIGLGHVWEKRTNDIVMSEPRRDHQCRIPLAVRLAQCRRHTMTILGTQ